MQHCGGGRGSRHASRAPAGCGKNGRIAALGKKEVWDSMAGNVRAPIGTLQQNFGITLRAWMLGRRRSGRAGRSSLGAWGALSAHGPKPDHSFQAPQSVSRDKGKEGRSRQGAGGQGWAGARPRRAVAARPRGRDWSSRRRAVRAVERSSSSAAARRGDAVTRCRV